MSVSCLCVVLLREGRTHRLLGRDVVKLVTPGTLIEPLHHHANYLMAIAPGPTLTSALAWLDLSTAEFQVGGHRRLHGDSNGAPHVK